METAALQNELNHLDFFGLYQNPFPVAPDAENFYTSPHINQILTEIIHGITTRKGFMVLDGEVGLGKTTITRRILNILEEMGIETSLVFHTAYQDVELLKEINRDFGIEVESLIFGDQMKVLNDFLLEQNKLEKNCAIIIDDAQNLDRGSLELVRMISNFEANQKKLVQILLVGQPELNKELNQPKLKQLKSRIIIWKKAKPLSLLEIGNYLYFKFNLAGSNGQIHIKKNALKKIYKFTMGNLRQINILMDRCLYVAFLKNTLEISKPVVITAAQDLAPDKFQLDKRQKGLFLIIGLSAFFLAGLAFFNPEFDYSLNPAFDIIKNTLNQKTLPITSHSQAPESASYNPDMNPLHEINDPVPLPEIPSFSSSSPVSDFLKAYQLLKFEPDFMNALKTGLFDNVAESIFAQTGLMLISLCKVPDHIYNKFDILISPSSSEKNHFFFLFWKPKLFLKEYYYAFQSEEIIILKKMLADQKLFNGTSDGIVDIQLMNAVTAFQKLVSLPMTGFPDEKTIFHLCHFEENKKNEPKKEKKIPG